MRERHLNILVLALLAAVPLCAYVSDEPFTITLSTKVAILALAGVGLLFQMMNWFGLPFPFNLLLWPLTLLEWTLGVAITWF